MTQGVTMVLICINKFKSIVLWLRYDVEVFFVDGLTLPIAVNSLNPSMIPVNVHFFTRNNYSAGFQSEQRAVAAKPNLSA